MHSVNRANQRMTSFRFLALFFTVLISRVPAVAQGTTFTYQGRLSTAAGPANGIYDLRFALWDSDSSGSMLGNAITNGGVAMTGGTFTVSLDFGNFFDGSGRWIEIGVRTNGGGSFMTLSPRQALTAAPYAIYAGGVNAAGISGAIRPANIANGTITSNMLAPGAAAANLATNGQSATPSSAVIFSGDSNDTNLTSAGYVPSGGFVTAQNLWRQRVATPVLAGRGGHTAFWTGNKMIVWGGTCGNDNPEFPPPKTRFTDGGCYDPAANVWSTIPTNGAPAGREGFSSVWSGTEMIIWGGYFYDGSYHYFNDGARYNLASNSWTAISTNGAPAPRYYQTAIWSGTEMIVWGGLSSDSSGFQLNPFNDGYRFNQVSNTWSPVNTNGAPAPRVKHTAVWTGTEMIIWGGQGGSGLNMLFNEGARYNPATELWSPITSTNAPSPRYRHTAVWTGSEMIIWGGSGGGGPFETTGGRYNPMTDTWITTDYLFAPSSRIGHTAVWTGREMIIWGGQYNGTLNDGGSYDPSSDTWIAVSTAPRAPAGRLNHTTVWTGTEMILFGGGSSGSDCFGDSWSSTPPKLLYLYVRH